MTTADVRTAFKNVVATVATRMSARDFVQKGMLLRKCVGGNTALVEFQLSDKSSKGCVLFTVNLGIVCGAITEEADLRNVGTIDAHLRQRFGFLLADRADKWWEIDSRTNAIALANEISDLLEQYAIPYLDEFLDSRSLIALWESGISPGLTAVQRSRFLARLKDAT